MKKLITTLVAGVLFVVMMSGMAFATETEPAAEEKEVIVHIKNQYVWPNLNIYNWGDAGEIFGAWPGTQITETADENGWVTYTFKTKATLNILFNSDFNEDGLFDKVNDVQTGDVKDIPADIAECWFIISGEQEGTEGELNPYEVDAAATAYLYSVPKDTWPVSDGFVAPEKELYTQTDVEFEPTPGPATQAPAPEDEDVSTTTTDDSAEEEDSEGLSMPIIIVIIAAVLVAIIIIVVIVKKKNK